MIKISNRICPIDHQIFLTVFPFVKTYADKFEPCAVWMVQLQKSHGYKYKNLQWKCHPRKYFPARFSLTSSCQATELTLVILIKQELKKTPQTKNILKVTILKEYIGFFLVRQHAQQALKTIQNVQSLRRREAKYFFFQTQNQYFWKNCTNHHKTWTLLSHPWTFHASKSVTWKSPDLPL